MNNELSCPVCMSEHGGSCTSYPGSHAIDCDYCGMYILTTSLYSQVLSTGNGARELELNPVQRATLSHRIRKKSRSEGSKSNLFLITPEVLDALRSSESLYDPAAQATDLIRHIGDRVSMTGTSIREIDAADIQREIGAPSKDSAEHITRELHDEGVVVLTDVGTLSGRVYASVNLSLKGWRMYAAEKLGRSEGNYGFMAMQFFEDGNDDRDWLDELVKNVVKPTVKAAAGCDLVDMRDVGRAGIIDNIMRMKIRDCKFVICDLTHDNNGAYWEAGYAEGLGKPVIYICEKQKFDASKTHFDTNHCTTIPWCKTDPEGFARELSATLRRSLDAPE